MTILHVHNNADPCASGTATAMWRIHTQLRENGVGSGMLCAKNADHFEEVDPVPELKDKYSRRIEDRLRRLARDNGLNSIVSLRSRSIIRTSAFQASDVLHFHTIHNSVYSYLSLPRLTRKKPAVYTLHDMWPLTGHCSFSYDCSRWQTGCGLCPYPDVYPPIKVDRTNWEWRLKGQSLRRSNVILAAPSRWMAEIAVRRFENEIPVLHVPNGVDLSVYKPADRGALRNALGIPAGKKVFLSGAVDLTSRRKGGDLLVSALNRLPPDVQSHLCVALMGRNTADLANELSVETVDLGFIQDEETKVAAYAAADCFVFPTRADNNPLMIIESIACGTPVISFRVGGVPELVLPGETGFLAESENSAELADIVARMAGDDALLKMLSTTCREVARRDHDIRVTADRYESAYSQLLERVSSTDQSG